MQGFGAFRAQLYRKTLVCADYVAFLQKEGGNINISELSDQSVSRWTRIQRAEEYRREHGCCIKHMVELTGIPYSTYHRYANRRLQAEHYLHIERYGEEVEPIFQMKKFFLYRKERRLYLSAAVRGRKGNERT